MSRVWVTIDGVGLVIGFMEHLYTRLVTASKYNAVTNSRTLQFTTARIKSSQSVFTSRCLMTASNRVLSIPLGSQTIPVPEPPASNSNSSRAVNRNSSLTHWSTKYFTSLNCTELNSTELALLIVLLITSKHGPHRKHRSSVVHGRFSSYIFSVVA
jgi:hypothetical protein